MYPAPMRTATPPPSVQASTAPLRRNVCYSCVADNADPWACGECAARYGTVCEAQRCAECVRSNPGATWSCLVASYASVCGANRRARLLQ